MLRIALVTALLATAALAGCTSGQEAQVGDGPAPPFRQAQDNSTSGPERGRDRGDTGNDGWRGDIRLEVEPKKGIAPLNVTFTYDVGRGAASEPDGQGRGNATGASGNRTSGNGTSGDTTAGPQGNVEADHANLTWTLEVWRMQPADLGRTGNATDGPPGASGNGTGNSTGNATGNSTGNSTGTATGTSTSGSMSSASGTTTGNSTGNSGNSTGEEDGDDGGMSGGEFPGGPGNLTLQVNGTWADLPGSTTQLVNASGHYKVRFTVDYGNGTLRNRTAAFHVRDLQDGDALGNETKTFEGSFVASEPFLCFGSEEFDLALNDTFGGHGANVALLNATLEADGFIDDYELVLVAPNGTEVAAGPNLEVEGPLGAGNYTLRVDSCTAVDTAFVVTAVLDYAYAKDPVKASEEAEE